MIRIVKNGKRIKINGIKTDYRIYIDGSVKNKNGKIMKASKTKSGYRRISLQVNGIKYSRMIHRLVAEAYIKNNNPNEYDQVNHMNGIKHYNHKRNLEWCSGKQNVEHAWKNGLSTTRTGESCNFHKLNETDIHDICKLISNGYNNKEISKILNLNLDNDIASIYAIRIGSTWVNISSQYNFKYHIPKRKPKQRDIALIKSVCLLLKNNLTTGEIRRKLNLPSTNAIFCLISDIKNRRTWTSVSCDYEW